MPTCAASSTLPKWTKSRTFLDQGRAPDFVLEIASPSTVSRDEERKREGYQDYRVQEYWRFDPSGGHFHRQSLAGDSLRDGTYRPMAIEEIHPGLLWGRSEMLGRSICWEYGYLRWWNPASERYLETQDQTADARNAAETPPKRLIRPGTANNEQHPRLCLRRRFPPPIPCYGTGGRQPRPQTPRFVLPIVTWAQLGPQLSRAERKCTTEGDWPA